MTDMTEDAAAASEPQGPPPLDPGPGATGDAPLSSDVSDEAAAEAMAELKRIDEADRFEGRPVDPPAAERYFPPIVPNRGYTQPMAPPLRDRPVGQGYAPPAPPPRVPAGPPGTLADAIGGFGNPPQPPWMGQQRAPVARETDAVITPPKDIRTLEDLYASYPKIGDGDHYLRIERTLPKTFNGRYTAGFLGNRHEPISMDAFAHEYGGQKYTVAVMGPVAGRTTDANGRAVARRLASVDLTIPGPPKTEAIEPEDPYMTTRQPGYHRPNDPFYPEPPAVAIKRLEVDENREKRLVEEQRRSLEEQRRTIDQLRDGMRPPEAVLDAVRQAGQEALSSVDRRANDQIQMLRESLTEALKSGNIKDTQIAANQAKIIELERAVSDARHYSETDQIRQLKERHEAELSRMKDTHAATVQHLNEESRRVLADTQAKNLDERQRITEAGTRDREMLRDDGLRRENSARSEAAARETNLKDTYNARIEDMTRQHDRELQALKDGHMREISSLKDAQTRELNAVKMSKDAEVTITREGSTMRDANLQERVARAEAENARLRREAEDLRAKLNKPIHEAIQEAHALASMTGMVSADEVKSSGSEGAPDWKGIAAGVLKQAIDQAPNMLGRLAEVRGAQQQQAVAVQQQQAMMAAQQQQMLAQQQGQMPQAQPGAVMRAQQRPQRRPVMAPPPAWATPQGPPDSGMAPNVPPPSPMPPMGQPFFVSTPAPQGYSPPQTSISPATPASAPMQTGDLRQAASPLQPEGYAPAPQPPPPPPGDDSWRGAPPASAAQAAAPLYAPTTTQAVPQPPAQVAPQAPSPSNAQALAFMNQLEQAIEGKMISPKMFAKGLVEEVTPPVAARLLAQVTPEFLFQQITQAGGGASIIQTRDGQAYVRTVWAEAAAYLKTLGF